MQGSTVARFALAILLASCANRHDPPPTSRTTVDVRVPSGMHIRRGRDSLRVSSGLDAGSTITLSVGAGMVLGMQVDFFVYPVGEPRPSTSISTQLSSPPDASLGSWSSSASEGIPAPGKSYAADADLTVFETDVPPGPMWDPRGHHFRVLWRGSLHDAER